MGGGRIRVSIQSGDGAPEQTSDAAEPLCSQNTGAVVGQTHRLPDDTEREKSRDETLNGRPIASRQAKLQEHLQAKQHEPRAPIPPPDRCSSGRGCG